MPSATKTIALIVNPVAGMGGSVGLKGTDGELYERAVELGAQPVSPDRTREFIVHIENMDDIALLVAPGQMGAAHVADLDLPFTVVGQISDGTGAEDTRRIAVKMVERGAELLVFVGGDGTARDVHDAIDSEIPVVAVPAGVKVYSSVFAVNPRAAAALVDAFVKDGSVTEEEVLDIDEEAFREDRLASRHYGTLLVPEERRFLQHGKIASSGSPSVEQSKREIATFVVEEMRLDTLYLLGPGTTVRAIAEELGLRKTLLGVDAVRNQRLIAEDLNEERILALLERYPQRTIIVTPLGGNGFILGRGNKQLTPEVIRQVGPDGVQVVSTRQKLQSLDCLRVDTGDVKLDQMLAGWRTVTVGYRESRMMRVEM